MILIRCLQNWIVQPENMTFQLVRGFIVFVLAFAWWGWFWHEHFRDGNIFLCGWRFKPIEDITMHVIQLEHFFKIFWTSEAFATDHLKILKEGFLVIGSKCVMHVQMIKWTCISHSDVYSMYILCTACTYPWHVTYICSLSLMCLFLNKFLNGLIHTWLTMDVFIITCYCLLSFDIDRQTFTLLKICPIMWDRLWG